MKPMKNLLKIVIAIILCNNFHSLAQKNKAFDQLKSINGSEKQMQHFLDFPFEFEISKNISQLLKKSASKLNTVSLCIDVYCNAKNLTEIEKLLIQKRMETLALRFFEIDYFVLFKPSGGIAPATGVSLEELNNKKVFVVLLGGSCSFTDKDQKKLEITTIFNNKMKSLLKAS